MSRIFLKYGLFIASFFIIVQIYLTVSYYQEIKKDETDLIKIAKIQEALSTLRNKKDFKALAAVIDDSNTYVYWYTYGHRTKQSAENIALSNCERERKKIKIDKKCRLFNSLINRQNYYK